MAEPRYLSKSLAEMLGHPTDHKLTWRELLIQVNKYIEKHKRRNKSDGRVIEPDAKMRPVFGSKSFDQMHIARALMKHTKACKAG